MCIAFMFSLLCRHSGKRISISDIISSFKNFITRKVLHLFLFILSVIINKNSKYNKKIRNFNGRYIIDSKDKSFIHSIGFHNNRVTLFNHYIEDPDIIISFKDSGALRRLLFSPKPDIIKATLNQDVLVDGNLNYLYKFVAILNDLLFDLKNKKGVS